MQHLRIVFRRLQDAGLTLKKAKCVFATAVVDYLGHTIGQDSVQPRAAKVGAMIDFPWHLNRKQLRSFWGLVGYYRRFIPHFASIVSALTDMLRKGEYLHLILCSAHQLSFLPSLRGYFLMKTWQVFLKKRFKGTRQSSGASCHWRACATSHRK